MTNIKVKYSVMKCCGRENDRCEFCSECDDYKAVSYLLNAEAKLVEFIEHPSFDFTNSMRSPMFRTLVIKINDKNKKTIYQDFEFAESKWIDYLEIDGQVIIKEDVESEV